VNRAQLVDPCRIEPKKLGALHAARPFADLFLGDIFPQRIVKAAGSVIGIEPRRLSFARQEPIDRDLRRVGEARD